MHTSASADRTAPAAAGEVVLSVDSGDTLWEIAKRHMNPSLDTRAAVQSIMERNGLDSSSLRSGQQLIIPLNILPR